MIFFFLIEKSKLGRPIVVILPKRDYSNTYSLGAVYEKLRRWESQALSQVQLNHNLINPNRTSMKTKLNEKKWVYELGNGNSNLKPLITN
jgi:hypothetical protein